MKYKEILMRISAVALIAIYASALSSCDKEKKSKVIHTSSSVTIKSKIEPQFKYVREFSDSLAAVCVGNDDCKWGYIDKDGKIVINPRFSDAGNFENGYAYVEFKKEGVLIKGILNKKNELTLINSTSNFVNRIYEGGETSKDISSSLVPFGHLVDGKIQIGFVDITGKVKIEPLYTEVKKFSEGMAAVQIGGENENWGFIDKKGKMLIEPQFQYVNLFKEGMAHIRIGSYEDGVYGFINTKGQVVVTPKFKNARDFKEGLAAVEVLKDGVRKWGFINIAGELVIDAIYFDYGNWMHGLYLHRTMTFSNGLAAVDFSGKQDNKWGYIDKSGKMTIEPQFALAQGFSEGMAGVRVGDLVDGKWGFIDTKGKFIVNPIYEEVLPFREGMAAVKTGKGEEEVWGFIERK